MNNDIVGNHMNMPFMVGIHDPLHVPDLTVSIEPGYKTSVVITPSQIVTSPNTKHLSKEERRCQFHDENEDLIIFKVYTEANCNFECKLKIAFDKCQCVPWDYPKLNDSMVTCDRFGRICFKRILELPQTTKNCSCLSDCTTTMYRVPLI